MGHQRRPLRGRTVLVTGAARGLGAAMARECDRYGASVALLGLEAPLLAEVAGTLRHPPHTGRRTSRTTRP
ncbi:SDR family NAD(P)-dependent oxidoreductase [Streptomyces sp. NPDC058304]|uniref:SDR family NAD(P)-dependent oxidoreductase n=1 Tax=Streptomyces sp. NPDC058304 TaxID=3346437 RepID=UPI0036E9679E